ncbi:class I SAM-dependent methyltransferase [Halalkalicoccus jeotgali]|uniref:Pyridine nucleotide-disulfide oxidoreductase, class II n=1 Tax=Halalkalicoccus jeotgali (strain DSM 18796 / CECT 7217 / JCM 14584 / KCTC 4019 / B3) TaxID=795797 RepID=D8J8Y8_HALJB|nr:class I SAM-dependent methyltransferase [Halalkalicoccus jeotgali]ADJ14323.1 pyridine nucleotide-disulfide oxidoreductase, class II, putative [Halalkalicoccus jeotgali B3]ELY40586.1 pyridine nucleotide-disulfide oxidoreductase, class II [Halalkalicoccus jeotgali B3]
MTDERTRWNERYRERDPPDDPSDLLREWVDDLPEGRALDVATGGGRNAICLAEHGYAVDAIDCSEEGLEIARDRASDRGVSERIGFVRDDVETYDFPAGTYDVIVVSRYYSLNVLPALKEALAPGGVLLYTHRLHPPGDRSSRFRFRTNELLRACLDLRIVRYEEPTEITDEQTDVRLIARKE